MISARYFVLPAIVGSTLAQSASAQWLQWGGPNRDFIVKTTGLADKWPEAGPNVLWKRELGDGYSTIVVEGDRLYTTYRSDGQERVVCLNARDGKTIWEHGYEAKISYKSISEYGGGPRSTPLIVGDRIFTVGAMMMLCAFDKHTGSVLWKRDLHADFGPDVPGRGYSSSPVAYGDTIILTIGGWKYDPATDPEGAQLDNGPGLDGQAIVAFDRKTGATRWKNQSFPISLSSPAIINVAGQDQLLVFGGEELFGLNPADGALFWRFEHKTQYGFNCCSPVFDGTDRIFISSAYGTGSRALQLHRRENETEVKELWHKRKIRIHYTNAVLVDGHVYGSTGMGPAFLFCQDLATGKVKWRERGFDQANVLIADGKMIILDQNGELGLATATPQELVIHSRCTVAAPYAFATPTLVGTTLYVRDRTHIAALDIG